MIKQFIRYETGEPFATVLIDDNKAGWSLCCPRDHFNKKRGELIAQNRLSENWEDSLRLRRPFNSRRCSIKVKRNGSCVNYDSKIDAVIDKIKYLIGKKQKVLKDVMI